MPLRASAFDAASGWISETTFGLTTTYFFVRRTGRIWSSTRASASATFFRRSSPRTSETTLVAPAPPRRAAGAGSRPRGPGRRRPELQEPPTATLTDPSPYPLRPILRADDDTVPASSSRRPGGGRRLPRPRLLARARLDPEGRGALLRHRDPLRLHGRQLRGLLRLRLHDHEGRHLRERGRRPAGDRRLRARRPRPRVGLLRRRTATSARRSRRSPRAARCCRARPRSPRAATTSRSRRARTRTTARRCARSSTRWSRGCPARRTCRRRSRSSRPRASTPDSVRLVPESVLGLRALRTGFVAQYADGRAFVVPGDRRGRREGHAREAARALRAGHAATAGIGDEALHRSGPVPRLSRGLPQGSAGGRGRERPRGQGRHGAREGPRHASPLGTP